MSRTPLIQRLCADLSFCQFGPVRFDVVHDAVVGSGKCDSSDQQDDEHHVGEGRCEVHNLKHTGTHVRPSAFVVKQSCCSCSDFTDKYQFSWKCDV